MVRCAHPGCGWRSIAPSERAANRQYEEHIVAEHTDVVEADVPEGMVEIRMDDDTWRTIPFEEAIRLQNAAQDEQ